MPETASIIVPIELLDRMSAQMNQISAHLESEAKKCGQGIAKGVAIGTMAIEAAKMAYRNLSGFVMSGVRDAMAAEQANNALGDSQARLAPYLEELADRLNTSDDAMKRGAATILKTGKVTDGFVESVMKGLPAFEDLGITVEQGSDAIAMGLMGATRGLKQFGIEMREGASTGEVITALTARFKEMEQRAIDAAEKPGKKIKGMVEAWGEVREAMGAKFLASLTTSEEGIKGMQASFEKLGTAGGSVLGIIIKGLNKVVEGAQEVGTSLGTVYGMQPYTGTFKPDAPSLRELLNFQDTGVAPQTGGGNYLFDEFKAREKVSKDVAKMRNDLAKELSLSAAKSEELARKATAVEGHLTQKGMQEELFDDMQKRQEGVAEIRKQTEEEYAAAMKRDDDARAARVEALHQKAKQLAQELAGSGTASTHDREKGAQYYEKRAAQEKAKGNHDKAGEFEDKAGKARYGKEWEIMKERGAVEDPVQKGKDAQNYRDFGIVNKDTTKGKGGIDTSKAAGEIKDGAGKVEKAITDLAGYFKASFDALSLKVDGLAGSQTQ